MATYCTASDLERFFVNIDAYDLKQTLNSLSTVTHSAGALVTGYKITDTGSAAKLWIDGVELTLDSAIPTEANHWYYDSDADIVYFCLENAETPTSSVIQIAPLDWKTAKDDACEFGSEWLEGLLDSRFPRPIPKTTKSNSSRDYDYIIIKASALLACLHLIKATDPNSPDVEVIQNQLWNDVDTGIIDMINAGKIKLSFEITRSSGGEIISSSRDATTTGDLIDVLGSPTTTYGRYKVEIVTGGTINEFSDNTTVTYKVTNREGETAVSTSEIDMGFQPVGGGMYARFTSGIYVAGDYWVIEVKGTPAETSVFRSIPLRRS